MDLFSLVLFLYLFHCLFIETELALRTKPGGEPSWRKGENLTEHTQWAIANQRSSLWHLGVQTEGGGKQINSCEVAFFLIFLKKKNNILHTHTHTHTNTHIHIYTHTYI